MGFVNENNDWITVQSEIEQAHRNGVTGIESLVAHVAQRLAARIESAPQDGLEDLAGAIGRVKQRVSDRAWIGKTVESGEGEDHDIGKVRAVLAPGVVEVAWSSQVITPASTSALRVLKD
jgi:hypothetical protein